MEQITVHHENKVVNGAFTHLGTHAEYYNHISDSFPPVWDKSTLRQHCYEKQTEDQDEEIFITLWEILERK